MICDADGALKEHLGRGAYIWSGAKNMRAKAFRAEVAVDGVSWFDGDVTCVLVGNVGGLFGGVEVFRGATPDDGVLEVGVVTSDGLAQWIRTIGRAMVSPADTSPFVTATKARKVKVKFDRKVLYELDGGDRSKTKGFTVKVQPAAVTVCVPYPDRP
jgi:diacylglycerol kinase family enzyme